VKNPLAPEAAVETPPGPARDEALPVVAGLRMEAALQRVGGNVKLMRKLLSRFVETQIDAMQRIATSIENNDLAGATREAHTVKGLAGNIGAGGMADAAGKVEQMLAMGATKGRDEAIAEMASELSDLVARIAMAMSLDDKPAAAELAPAAQAVDMAELTAVAHEMARLLAQDDGAAVKLLDRLCGALSAAGQAEHARQMRRMLGQYDFEGALDELKAAADALNIAL